MLKLFTIMLMSMLQKIYYARHLKKPIFINASVQSSTSLGYCNIISVMERRVLFCSVRRVTTWAGLEVVYFDRSHRFDRNFPSVGVDSHMNRTGVLVVNFENNP